MAKYTVTCKCGHVQTVNLTGKWSYREYKLEQYENDLCSSCKAKKREEEFKKQEKISEELGYIKLQGSPKQIQWGESIRLKFDESEISLDNVFANIFDNVTKEYLIKTFDIKPYKRISEENRKKIYDLMLDAKNKFITEEFRSTIYIDNRNDFNRLLAIAMENFMFKILEENKGVGNDNNIVKPENNNNHVVDIVLNKQEIEILSTKNEELIKILKDNGLKWNSFRNAWVKTIKKINGDIIDRASEIGNKLLLSGFIIKCDKKEILEKATNADFEPENPRLLDYYKNGLLVISWEGVDNCIYNQAKKIPSARWVSGTGIVVSPNFKNEILDFVELNDFRVTKQAEKILSISEEVETTIDIKKPKEIDKLVKEGVIVIPDLEDN